MIENFKLHVFQAAEEHRFNSARRPASSRSRAPRNTTHPASSNST